MALFFGLLYFYEHHQWRSLKSRSALVLSLLFLALSVFAEEGGAAAFAFIVAAMPSCWNRVRGVKGH